DGGSRFDEGLHTGVLGNPLLQVVQVGYGVIAAGAPRVPTTPKPVEQSHLGPAPSLSPLSIVPELPVHRSATNCVQRRDRMGPDIRPRDEWFGEPPHRASSFQIPPL